MSLFEGVGLILTSGVNLFDTWFEYMSVRGVSIIAFLSQPMLICLLV